MPCSPARRTTRPETSPACAPSDPSPTRPTPRRDSRTGPSDSRRSLPASGPPSRGGRRADSRRLATGSSPPQACPPPPSTEKNRPARCPDHGTCARTSQLSSRGEREAPDQLRAVDLREPSKLLQLLIGERVASRHREAPSQVS